MTNDSFSAEALWTKIRDYLISALGELTFMNHFGMDCKGISLVDNTLMVELAEDKNASELSQQFAYFIQNALRVVNAPAGMRIHFQHVASEIPEVPVVDRWLWYVVLSEQIGDYRPSFEAMSSSLFAST